MLYILLGGVSSLPLIFPPLHDSKKNCIIGQLERLGLPKIDFIWSQYVLLVNLMVP